MRLPETEWGDAQTCGPEDPTDGSLGIFWPMWWMLRLASEESARMRSADRWASEKAWEETWRLFNRLEIPQLPHLSEGLDRLTPKSQAR
jgi:hypothetical protein